MKLSKILVAIFLLLPLPANAGLTISSWQENANLTETGRTSEVFIQGRISGLPANMAMSSFSIMFDPKQDLRIRKVIADNRLSDYSKNADYTFNGNVLTVKFPQGKKNGEVISLYLAYAEFYGKINEFLRQEMIYVPDFAAGATTKVTLNFPGYFESATFNPNVNKVGNSFVYSNIVPKNGVHEIIKLTPAQESWDVTMKTTINASKPLGKMIVKIPTFFQSPRQKVENYRVTSDVTPTNQSDKGSETIFDFDTKSQQVSINNSAKITTGLINRRIVSRNPADYLAVTPEESNLLSPILLQIRSDSSYGDIPLYAKIGKFVHDYLRYDISYLGKLPPLTEVIRNRVGVCTEYARLFDVLVRLGGIPSIVIDGGACGEYDECQGHSWNLIYYQGQWIEVDPTWNLMSGIVSSSHVYFNDAGKGESDVQYFDRSNDIRLKVDLEMRNLP